MGPFHVAESLLSLLSRYMCLLPWAHTAAAASAITTAESTATAIIACFLTTKQVQTVRHSEHHV